MNPLGLLWFFLLGVTFVALIKRAWKLVGATVPAVVGLMILCNTPLAVHCLARLEAPYAASALNATSRVDAVIMLGGTHGYSPRALMPLNLGEAGDRVLTAGELMRRGASSNLVLGGAGFMKGGQWHTESELVETWFRRWQVPAGRLHHLGRCANTREEAERAAALAKSHGWTRMMLVTSAYHLRRSEATFRRLGVDVIPVGCDFFGLDALDSESEYTLVPRARALEHWNYLIHEELGWWWYRWKGWI